MNDEILNELKRMRTSLGELIEKYDKPSNPDYSKLPEIIRDSVLEDDLLDGKPFSISIEPMCGRVNHVDYMSPIVPYGYNKCKVHTEFSTGNAILSISKEVVV